VEHLLSDQVEKAIVVVAAGAVGEHLLLGRLTFRAVEYAEFELGRNLNETVTKTKPKKK
jgi:hypothetical protein